MPAWPRRSPAIVSSPPPVPGEWRVVNGEWSVERLFALFAIRHSLFTNHYSLVGLHLDVGRLDDRPPFVHLGLVEGGERFRRQLLARRDGLPQIRNALAHARIREGGDNGIIQLGDDVSRGSLGRPQPMPERDVHARYSDLFHGGDVGQ